MSPTITTREAELLALLGFEMMKKNPDGTGECPGTDAPCWGLPLAIKAADVDDNVAADLVVKGTAAALSASLEAILGAGDSAIAKALNIPGAHLRMTVEDGTVMLKAMHPMTM